VVAEAAALGIPSIVSDGCAARDGVVDGITGLLFRSGDIDDLAQKIAMLNSDPTLALRLGQAAYSKYWANPSTLDSHVQELLECYRRIMSESN
jgi:glycosyltransferase involved in cell wall biosynthesis